MILLLLLLLLRLHRPRSLKLVKTFGISSKPARTSTRARSTLLFVHFVSTAVGHARILESPRAFSRIRKTHFARSLFLGRVKVGRGSGQISNWIWNFSGGGSTTKRRSTGGGGVRNVGKEYEINRPFLIHLADTRVSQLCGNWRATRGRGGVTWSSYEETAI